MTDYTPDSLRAIPPSELSRHWPNEHHAEWCKVCAHADAWQATETTLGTTLEVNEQLLTIVRAKNAEVAALRERLEALLTIIHNLRTCKGNATDDGPCGQCVHAADVALASQPPDVVPNSDDIRTSHDTKPGSTADQRDERPCWAGGNIAGE